LFRYESSGLYEQTTLPGNAGICGNTTTSQSPAFSAAVKEVLADLQVATPRIKGFFAASKKQVVGGVGNATVYAVAQCVETVTEKGCQDCLTVAVGNADLCLPGGVARAVDAGCFLRYSDTPFFADNQTTNITPFLGNGEFNSFPSCMLCIISIKLSFHTVRPYNYRRFKQEESHYWRSSWGWRRCYSHCNSFVCLVYNAKKAQASH
jgi:hypothetical protein